MEDKGHFYNCINCGSVWVADKNPIHECAGGNMIKIERAEDKDIVCECGEKFKTLVDLDIHRKIYHPMLGMMVKDMPVRVLLIGMAMQGIMANSNCYSVEANTNAFVAIKNADAVIKKLEEEK